MACFIIIGEEPCTVGKTLEIMGTCERIHVLCEKWQTFALELGLTEAVEDEKVSNAFKCTMENLESLLFHLLILWKEKNGFRATLHYLCQALSLCGVPEIAGKLMIEFIATFTEDLIGISGIWFPMNLIKISEIFSLNSGCSGKRMMTDRFLGLGSTQIANKFVSRDRMGSVFELLIDQLSPEDLKIMEGYAFVKLHLDYFAKMSNVDLYGDDTKPMNIMAKMNVTNKGMHYVYWFIVARALLKAEFDNQRKMRLIYRKVFSYETDKRDKINGVKRKFKNELVVYFIDLVVGLWKEKGYELYNSRLHLLGEPWLSTYVYVCLKTTAINLIKDFMGYSEFLHKLVHNTVQFDASRLELWKSLALEKIKEDPRSVDVINQEGLSPLMMKGVHVDLLEVLIDNTEANVHRVDTYGRNVVHLASEYLPVDQLRAFVRKLIQLNQTSVLDVRDSKLRTPLIISMQKFDSKPDVMTIQLFAAAGVDFNATDEFGLTPLYYAVSRRKSPDILAALIECGADWRWRKWDGSTLLHIAAREGTVEQFMYLLSIGCGAYAVDDEGKTPLHVASSRFIS